MTQQETRLSRFWITLAIRVSLGLGLLGLALWLSRNEIAEVLAHRPDYRLFALAFLAYFSGVALAYVRWFWLVRAVGLDFTLKDAFRLGLIGTFFNLVIPGAIGGDFVKAAYLTREQHRKERAIASIVIDRIVGLIGLFVLAAATGLWFWPSLEEKVRGVVLAAVIALAVSVLVLGLCFLIRPHGPVTRRLAHRPNAVRRIAELAAAGTAYRRRFDAILGACVLAAVTHLGNVAAFHLVSLAMFPAREVPSLAQELMIVPLVLFSTAIPLPFGALGASEGVSRLLFRSVGFLGGAIAMLGFRLLQFGSASVGAVVYLANRTHVRALTRQPGADAEGAGTPQQPLKPSVPPALQPAPES